MRVTTRRELGSRRIPIHDHADLNSGGKLTVAGAISGGLAAVGAGNGDAGGTATGGTDSTDLEIEAVSGSALTIDYSLAQRWHVTLTANCTLTISNPPASDTWGELLIVLVQGGVGSFTVTWPAAVDWPDTDGTGGGAAPTLHTAVGAQDVVTLVTIDGGTTWGGSHGDVTVYSDSVSAETTLGLSSSAGTAVTASRGDHTHGSPAGTAIAALGFVKELLISDTPSTPLVFADLLQNEAQDDLIYAD
jgi:hypothetical protein